MTVKKAGQIAHGASLAHEVGDLATGTGKPKPTSKGGSVGMRQAGTLAGFQRKTTNDLAAQKLLMHRALRAVNTA